MKAIAKSANDFKDLRTKKVPCIYVDKTAHFLRLITDPESNLFFIARPRRFGKSLMITTFKYIFEGRRELFKGLKIGTTDYDWKVHPVIHLNFGLCARGTHAAFMSEMSAVVKSATEYNPVSTGLTFAYPRDEFRGTWTETGRPSMLMNFIKREGLLAIDYETGVTAQERL